MITLFGSSDTLRLVSSSTANLVAVCNFSTLASGGSVVKGRQRTPISTATTTTIVDAPGSGEERTVYSIVIRNTHASTANTVTVLEHDGTTGFERLKVTLSAGEQLLFDGLNGWTYLNAQGMPKTAQSLNSSPVAVNQMTMLTLPSDVVNNNAVANTMQDVTGLSFPVIAGQTYHFEFFIDYTAAATTTGSRWSVDGPSFSRLAYQSSYALTSSSLSFNNLATYNQPAASNATSAQTAGNLAWMAGLITPSVDGNVIARFASEVAGSAITAKAGSLLKWTRTL